MVFEGYRWISLLTDQIMENKPRRLVEATLENAHTGSGEGGDKMRVLDMSTAKK